MSSSSPPLSRSSGAFDAQHPPSAERVADCVHCGFCLPTCPTYVLWGEEADSPRGRIHLVKLALEGHASLDAPFRRHFDNCLGCMACLTSCPSGVQYDVIVEATRPQLERHSPRTAADRRFRAAILALFPYRGRLRIAAIGAWLARKTGLQALWRWLQVPRRLPPRLRALEALTPDVSLVDALRGPARPARVDSPRARVAMLEGCVQSVFFANVNAATQRVLAAEGVQVVPVSSQGCCGALELHAGVDHRARRRVRDLVERFEQVDVERVLVNAAGCGSHLKTVDRLFDADDPFRARAEAFVAKVRDIFEFLAEIGPQAELHSIPARVAYHDACHLAHAQGIRAQPRAMLRRIPGLELLEVDEPDICCGSAGIYNLVKPEPAGALGRRKAQHVSETQPDILAAANPGCLLQIRRHLAPTIRTVHPIELLAEALRPGAHGRAIAPKSTSSTGPDHRP